MKNKNVNAKLKALKALSSVSTLEVPALLAGLLVLVPGLFDEALLGIASGSIYLLLALGRNLLVNKRAEYIRLFDEALEEGEISEDLYKSGLRALNTLTVEGGTEISNIEVKFNSKNKIKN